MNQDNLPIDNLDFDLIKKNLKTYLRGQDKFKDYDFEASGLNILLDLLAYNTHYQAFYANMVANEAFMDSAVSRSSAVSLAKHLGYTPKSIKASKATVDIDLGNNSTLISNVAAGTAFILRGEPFIGRLETGKTYNFTANKNYKVEFINGRCVVRNVEIYEGSYRTYSFVYNSFDSAQKFILPSDKIDTDTIVVRVQKSVSDSEGLLNSWFRSTDITTLDADSNAFFLQETENGKFEIYFGDGIIGKQLQNGNVVVVEFLVTNGAAGNGCKAFTYMPNNNPALSRAVPTVSLTVASDGTVSPSDGGTGAETLDSIKYYSPRSYQAQERAVTIEDYSTLLSREFLERAESFFVWGGEENDPPQYGKVFISIKPKVGTTISTLEKLAIQKTILGKRNIVSILPEVVDPDYLYLVLNMNIRYDPSKATLSPSALESLVRIRIGDFSTENLQKFGKNFRLSKFSTYIDDINPTISSNTVDIKLQKRFEPRLGSSSPYTLRFDTPLFHPIDGYPSILESTGFGYQDSTSSSIVKPNVDCYLDDDGFGNVRIYKFVGANKVYISESAGTIDYNKGVIVLKNFNPQYINPRTETELRITVKPNIKDIEPRRNQIILIDNELVLINLEQESYRIDQSESGSRFPY
jgi:hypothetical protein